MIVQRTQMRLWIALAALLFGVSCAGFAGREPLRVTVAGVEPMQGEGLELRLGVKLRVQNPNEHPIDFRGAAVDLEVEGKRFASGVSSESGNVPGYGETIVTIPVTASAFQMAFGALRVINGRYRGKVDYSLQGKLDGPTFNSVHFDSKGTLDLTD
jgi:LEA14-like dessication related protein